MTIKSKKLWLALLSCGALTATLAACGCTPQTPYESTLTGFEFPQTLNYYYGACVDVLDPIVLDDLGNVMDIDATVTTKDGEAVKVEYGKFFAVDKDGYTIRYTVKTQDNKVHERTSTLNVVEALYDNEVKLLDVDGATSYDILNILSEDQRAAMLAWQGFEGVTYTLTSKINAKSVDLENTTVDFTALPKSYYTFAIEMPIGYPAKQEKVFTCNVDFYDAADGIEWVGDTLSLDYLFMKDASMTGEIVKEGLPAGAAAEEYYRVKIGENEPNAAHYLLSVAGLHSREYYEEWQKHAAEKFQKYTFAFDFYYSSVSNENSSADGEYSSFRINGTQNTNYFENKWYTFELDFDKLLQYFPAYNDPANIYIDASYSETVNMISSTYSSYYGSDIDGYIGNFRFVETLDLSAVENDELALIDMKDKTSFDFLSLLGEEKKAEIEDYATKYDVVWTLDGNAVTDWAKVDGIYEVMATVNTGAENIPVYKQTVDFYNSGDGLVWVDTLDLKHLVLKNSAMTGAIVNTDLPTGAVAGEYYHVGVPQSADKAFDYVFSVTAKHSKAYYELWKEKAEASFKKYTLSVDFYLSSTANTKHNNDGEYIYFYLNGTPNAAYYEGTWTTLEITLDELINNYEAYGDSSYINYDKTHSQAWNMVYCTDISYEGIDLTALWGNFRFAETLDLSAVENDELALIDMKDKTEFDFLSLLDEDKKAEIQDYATAYEVTWTLNGNAVTDWAQVDGVYEVMATAKIDGEDIPLYKQTVDFYDSADGLVWTPTSGLKTDDVYLKKTNAEVSIATENLPDGLTESEYYLISSNDVAGDNASQTFAFAIARHSKAYYEMWLASGKDYTISFDVYYQTNAEILFVENFGEYSVFNYGGTSDPLFTTDEKTGKAIQMIEETKVTLTCSLQSLVNNYDDFFNDEKYSCGTWSNNFFIWASLEHGDVSANATTGKIDMQTYIGNFQVTEA